MNTEKAIYPTEDGNFISFEWDTDKNNAKSSEAGRPVFDKILRATVFSPGSSKSEAVHILERWGDDDKKPMKRNDVLLSRFRKPYDAFMADNEGDGGVRSGTPLDAWPALDVRQIASLKAMNIYTVEALADLSDTAIQAVGMGARDLKARAKAFIDAASGGAAAEAMAAENERLRAEVEMLRDQVKDLAAKIEDKPKRGRPPKTEG